MADFDSIIVFGKKTMSDILKDIYDSSKRRGKEIEGLIEQLSPMIVNAGDAVILVPLIAKYMEISVTNDEHIIKMIAIVQKASTRAKTEGSDEPELNKDERAALLNEFNAYYEKHPELKS